MKYVLTTTLLLWCSLGLAAPPDVPKEVKAKPGQLIRIPLKTDAKIGQTRSFSDEEAFFGELVAPTGQRQFVFQAPTEGYKSEYTIAWWTVGEDVGTTTKIILADATPVIPPKPVDPNTPDPPIPVDPLKSFRVIFIYESGMTPTVEQRAVIYGKVVEDYLNANCTSGKNGWRRRDKDTAGDSDPTMADLWKDVQPKVTSTPCVAVERNGKVEIINLDSTPAKMIETFQKYRGK